MVEIAKKNNRPIKKAALVGDNTAATVFFFKPLREKLLAAKGIELVVDEVWTPPLADATSIVQKLRATQPDIVFYGATNFPDSVQVLQKVKEFNVKTTIQGVGAWLVTPEYVKTIGKEILDDIQTVVAAHPLKGQEELVKKFVQRTGEPFMTQDPLCTYAHVWLIKEAAEQAKSADPKAIREALAKIDLTDGPGRHHALSRPHPLRRARPPGGRDPDHRAVAERRALHGGADRGGHPPARVGQVAPAAGSPWSRASSRSTS